MINIAVQRFLAVQPQNYFYRLMSTAQALNISIYQAVSSVCPPPTISSPLFCAFIKIRQLVRQLL
jgi:hypothetical protein